MVTKTTAKYAKEGTVAEHGMPSAPKGMGRVFGPAPAEAVTYRWDPFPSSVPAARRQLREALRGWGLADLADDCVLVLTELLSNALAHAHGPDPVVSTRFSRLADGCGVRIEVHDSDTAHVPVRDSGGGADAERGRGLLLVDACTARRWGTVLGATGKAVWGEVAR